MSNLFGMEVGLGPSDFVLDADPATPPQKGGGALSPIIGPCRLWPNGWTDQDGTWHAGGPWSKPHCVRWGTSSPSPKGGAPSQFSANVYYGQMAAWIKMPLGTEVGLGQDDIVLDEDQAPLPRKGAQRGPQNIT